MKINKVTSSINFLHSNALSWKAKMVIKSKNVDSDNLLKMLNSLVPLFKNSQKFCQKAILKAFQKLLILEF